MRCKACGSIMHHVLTDINGNRYYRCTCGLTGFDSDGSRLTTIRQCGTVQDNRAQIIPNGRVAYIGDGKLTTLKIDAGRIV